MLVVLSPAKKLDWSDRGASRGLSEPEFIRDASHLANLAQAEGAAGLKRLMGISDKLADLNITRFQDFALQPAPDATRAAIYGFAGDTYTGLDAASLGSDTLDWAEGHLRILSGLYGVLKPFDALQPYRLEMGSRLAGAHGRNLYDYWGSRIAEALNTAAQDAGTGFLVNCASQEYFGAVDLTALQPTVITPVFMDQRKGDDAPKVISFHAKRARGAMARFILEQRVQDPASLHAFDHGGYRFEPASSSAEQPVFLRLS